MDAPPNSVLSISQVNESWEPKTRDTALLWKDGARTIIDFSQGDDLAHFATWQRLSTTDIVPV